MKNSWAAPGVWCECVSMDSVDDTDPRTRELIFKLRLSVPEVGSKYQVYDVRVHPTNKERVGVRLVGFSPYIVFDIEHFRPLQQKDQEVFRSMLKDIPAEEKTDA